MQKNRTKLLSAILLTLGSAGTAANAQSQLTGFTGSAEAKVSHDDNIYRTTDEFAQSDSLITLKPEAMLAGIYGKHRFQINYRGDYAKHFDLDDANYDDHTISALADFDHTLRFKTRFEASYIKEHQDPGTINRVQLDLSEYNLYNETRYGFSAFYGNNESTGRLEFRYRNSDIDYTNNNLDFLDNNFNQFGAKFIYRMAPKTKTYIELIYIDLDYTPPAGEIEQDNTNVVYRAGINWDFANKVSGDINIGYQEREFDNQTLRNTSGLAYSGSVTWSLTSFTEVELEANREALDSTIEEFGSFVRTSYSVKAVHGFTERLSLDTEIRYYNDDLSLGQIRENERFVYELGVNYELMNRLTIGTSFAHQSRNSTLATAEYESNVVSIFAKFDIE